MLLMNHTQAGSAWRDLQERPETCTGDDTAFMPCQKKGAGKGICEEKGQGRDTRWDIRKGLDTLLSYRKPLLSLFYDIPKETPEYPEKG